MIKSEIPFGPIKNCLVVAYDDMKNSLVTFDVKVYWWPSDPEYFDADGPEFVNIWVEYEYYNIYRIYWKNLVKVTDKSGNKIERSRQKND